MLIFFCTAILSVSSSYCAELFYEPVDVELFDREFFLNNWNESIKGAFLNK
jgi:hypothetical protein